WSCGLVRSWMIADVPAPESGAQWKVPTFNLDGDSIFWSNNHCPGVPVALLVSPLTFLSEHGYASTSAFLMRSKSNWSNSAGWFSRYLMTTFFWVSKLAPEDRHCSLMKTEDA